MLRCYFQRGTSGPSTTLRRSSFISLRLRSGIPAPTTYVQSSSSLPLSRILGRTFFDYTNKSRRKRFEGDPDFRHHERNRTPPVPNEPLPPLPPPNPYFDREPFIDWRAGTRYMDGLPLRWHEWSPKWGQWREMDMVNMQNNDTLLDFKSPWLWLWPLPLLLWLLVLACMSDIWSEITEVFTKEWPRPVLVSVERMNPMIEDLANYTAQLPHLKYFMPGPYRIIRLHGLPSDPDHFETYVEKQTLLQKKAALGEAKKAGEPDEMDSKLIDLEEELNSVPINKRFIIQELYHAGQQMEVIFMLEANDGSRALVTWTMQRRYVPLLQIGDLQIGRTIALSPLYCFIDFPRNERLYFEVDPESKHYKAPDMFHYLCRPGPGAISPPKNIFVEDVHIDEPEDDSQARSTYDLLSPRWWDRRYRFQYKDVAEPRINAFMELEPPEKWLSFLFPTREEYEEAKQKGEEVWRDWEDRMYPAAVQMEQHELFEKDDPDEEAWEDLTGGGEPYVSHPIHPIEELWVDMHYRDSMDPMDYQWFQEHKAFLRQVYERGIKRRKAERGLDSTQ